jgi:hypothetical protein
MTIVVLKERRAPDASWRAEYALMADDMEVWAADGRF